MKRCLTSLFVEKMQIKTTLGYLLNLGDWEKSMFDSVLCQSYMIGRTSILYISDGS